MNTVLEILLVNAKSGTSKKTGQAFNIKEAHCVMRDMSGAPGGVGVLTVPRHLEEKAVPGFFTAAFKLAAPTYGPDAGKIIAELDGLTPISKDMLRPAPSSAAPK